MAHGDDLPLPDYGQLPLTELRHRIRALDEADLQTLFDQADASVFPWTTHGNTPAPTVMVGEKAADLLVALDETGKR